MPTAYQTASICASFILAAGAIASDGVQFTDETSIRMPTPPNDPALSTLDPEEKDYAWGDFDHDGDIDLAVARKQPATSTGRRRNVLFMNENGVLIDRTIEYATAADDGGQGFLDLTNDRDIVATDVNGDGWLDLVTATTYGQGLPAESEYLSLHLYQGESKGKGQGFVDEEARVQQLPSWPDCCGVAAGDVTGDGFPDLYFVDYDNIQPNSFDDRLLINDGNGFFVDQSTARMPAGFLDSAFGIHTVIVDLNNDGWNDILKNENGPIKVAYNAGNGFFSAQETIYSLSAYFFSTGDLNADGLLDIVVSDDGTDRYLLNQGNGGDGFANFNGNGFLFPPSTGGFGGNSVIADLNRDGFNDVLIADFDVDVPGCSRISDILRNNANPPNVTFVADTGGIPSNMLNGVHDIGVFDVNGDCWLDLVIGRCNTTTVWINQGDGTDCPSCTGDLDDSGDVGVKDLLILLGAWGPCPKKGDCPADFDGSSDVGVKDLLILLGNWGPCS